MRMRERLRWLIDHLPWRRRRTGQCEHPQAETSSRDVLGPRNHTPSAINLGDLLTALARLAPPDEATTARIARSLGFATRASRPPGQLRGAYDQRRAPGREQRPSNPPPPPLGAPPFSREPPPPALPERPMDSELTRLATAAPAVRPDWLDLPLPSERTTPPPRRAPLLPRRTASGVLAAAVATRGAGNEPDIHRITASVSRGHSLRRLPMRPVARLDRGIQLLLDGGESMTPYRDDLADLAGALERVLGHARCKVFELADDPRTAVAWDASGNEQPWRPERGRPIVLATDFGLGAPASVRGRRIASTWPGFIATAKRAGSPLIAFVPLPPAHWPVRLSRLITLIHWDPRTTAGAVRRLVGAGHRVQP